MKKTFTSFLLFFITFQTFAGGIRGIVKTIKNEPLAYAAVAIKGSAAGTMANAEGRFELNLAAGKYTVSFQYLGFKTVAKEVEVGVSFVDLTIVLEEQALSISEVKVGSKTEDPALTVMRRAISKARFHALQVDSYSARVYAKNTIVFDKINFLVRKQAEKEGFKEGKAIVNESVSEIKFSQPNKYVERVISTRNNFDDKGINPNQFVMSSFYEPTIVNTVSPLSPKAFGYYKFEYMGSFQENGVEVNKIKVIPRSYSDGVFRGQIYIFEDTWAIHSLSLETIVEGFSINIKQVYNPVQGVQMPTNQNFHVVGGMMGFGLTFDYVVSVNYNSLKVNPSFREPPTIIDEKFKKPDNTISKTDIRTKKLEDLAGQQKELSTKQMRQLMREYEKQNYEERKAKKEDVAVVENDSVVIDSMANKRSDAFWNEVRMVPLTAKELKSYSDFDSLKTKKAMNIKSDSNSLTIGIGGSKSDTTKSKKKQNGVSLMDLLTTKTYELTHNKKQHNPWILKGQGPLNPDNVNYNLVEGVWLQSGLRLSKFMVSKFDSTKTRSAQVRNIPKFFLETVGRYDFGRKQLLGKISTGLASQKRFVKINTGHFVAQYNADNPVGDGINAITTLLFKQNLMKLYEKKYAQIEFGTELSPQNVLSFDQKRKKLYLSGSLEWAQRSQLNNLDGFRPIIDSKNREYTANAPVNIELPNTTFQTNTALILNAALTWQPGREQFRVKNGIKYDITKHDMNLKLHYSRGIPNVANSEVDFDLIDLTWRQNLETGIRSDLKYSITAGAFLNNNKMYFTDYKHFMGNEFFVQTGDGLSTFRALPYYIYSTRERFLEAHVTSTWRKLALTQIPYVRLLGFKENLLFHYLRTPQTPHYAEIGYGFDGLIPGFPFFRVEAVGTFLNFKYQNTVFRIGTTWKFGGN